MKSLLIDTSSHTRIVAVLEDDHLLIQKMEPNGLDLSSRMIPMLEETLKEIQLDPKDIDTLYVVTGPGSFTGIRVGVTIAKTYAWALQKKIVPLSELELLATTPFEGDYIVPYLDARRDFGYAAIYDHSGKMILQDSHISRIELLNRIPADKKVIFVTEDSIEVPYEIKKPSIDLVEIVKRHQYDSGVNPHECNPNYLKLTEAEENLVKMKHD